MSRIKGKDTKPEMVVRRYLFAHGFRFRLHDKKLPGKPDVVISKYQTAIFIHGCFWHGHANCRYFVVPKTRTDWWLNKIQGNQQRDHENKAILTTLRWKVITIFECELKSEKKVKTLSKIVKNLGYSSN
jgi:DNA mismatch endonuclease (patch repair protein)